MYVTTEMTIRLEVLRKVVPTFKRPEEVNKEVGAEVEPEDNSLPQRRVRA